MQDVRLEKPSKDCSQVACVYLVFTSVIVKLNLHKLHYSEYWDFLVNFKMFRRGKLYEGYVKLSIHFNRNLFIHLTNLKLNLVKGFFSFTFSLFKTSQVLSKNSFFVSLQNNTQ